MSLSRVANMSGGSGLMTLVNSATVTGAAATTLTVGGLNLTTDGSYYIEVMLKNASGSTSEIRMELNGDQTVTNYYRQYLYADGGGPVSGRQNNNHMHSTLVTGKSLILSGWLMKDFDGNPVLRCHMESNTPSANDIGVFNIARNNTANITSFAVSTSVASAIAIGSYIKVYKVGQAAASGSVIASTMTEVTGTKTVASALIPYDNTAPLISEGVEFTDFATTYTPTDASSVILVELRIPTYSLSLNVTSIFTIWKDTTLLGSAMQYPNNSNWPDNAIFTKKFVAGSTSPFTIKVRAGGSTTCTVRINTDGTVNLGDTITSTLRISEIKA